MKIDKMENKTTALIICVIIIVALLFYIVINILTTNAYEKGVADGQVNIVQRIGATSELPELIFDKETNLTYITWKQFGQYCLDNVCGG